MSDDHKTGVYNKRVNRELFAFGDEKFSETLTQVLEPLPFIKKLELVHLERPRNDFHFLIACGDFTDTESLQKVARCFYRQTGANTHKIFYARAPEKITQDQLLFAAEIGARFTIYGPGKEKELRSYLKRTAIEAEQLGSVSHYENEIAKMVRKADGTGLAALDERLSKLGRDTEDVLRLKILINERLSKRKKVESYLRKILEINPQNLWAANELGKLYLLQKRASEGTAILEKISRFHDLNGERLLELGTAYLNMGNAEKASAVLGKGEKLSSGTDGRFKEGLLKAKILQGSLSGASQVLSQTELNDSVVSFLNMRAIMAIKVKKFSQGFNFYHIALNGCRKDDMIKAKLAYNLGLGYVRSGDYENAQKYFSESLKFGGRKFRKAEQPLSVTKKILKKKLANKSQDINDDIDMDFEELHADIKQVC